MVARFTVRRSEIAGSESIAGQFSKSHPAAVILSEGKNL
jgi:hypothetical protein